VRISSPKRAVSLRLLGTLLSGCGVLLLGSQIWPRGAARAGAGALLLCVGMIVRTQREHFLVARERSAVLLRLKDTLARLRLRYREEDGELIVAKTGTVFRITGRSPLVLLIVRRRENRSVREDYLVETLLKFQH
jgi:hypothetical protein